MDTALTTQLTSEWAERTISSFFSRNVSGEWGSEPTGDNSPLVVGTPDFNNDGTIAWDQVKRRDIAPPKLNPRLLSAGDILVEKSGGSDDQPAGRVVYCDRTVKGTCSNFVQLLSVNEELHPRFIFYLLYYHYKKGLVYPFQQKTTGIINFKINQYFQTLVSLPKSFEEQSAIAAILNNLDETTQETETLISKLKRVKQGLMHDLLTRGIDEKGNIRNEKTHKFKDSPLGQIPEEWDPKRIIDLIHNRVIIEVQDGNHGELYPRKSDFVEEGIPFVSAQHILKNGQLDFGACPKLPRDYVKRLRIGFGKPGDVILAHNATVGRVGIVEHETEFVVSTSTTYYRVKQNLLDRYFLLYFMQAHPYQRQLADIMGQTTRNQVPITAQKQLWIVFPHRNEQSRIARVLTDLDTAINKEDNNWQKLQALKRGLVEDLLTGKVRVNHLLKQ